MPEHPKDSLVTALGSAVDAASTITRACRQCLERRWPVTAGHRRLTASCKLTWCRPGPATVAGGQPCPLHEAAAAAAAAAAAEDAVLARLHPRADGAARRRRWRPGCAGVKAAGSRRGGAGWWRRRLDVQDRGVTT